MQPVYMTVHDPLCKTRYTDSQHARWKRVLHSRHEYLRRKNDADEVYQTRRKPAEEYRLGTKNSKANSQELQHGGRHR